MFNFFEIFSFSKFPPVINNYIFAFYLCICLVQLDVVEGFKQELWLYQGSDNESVLHFTAHVPDTTSFRRDLRLVKRYCARGKWFVYDGIKFKTFSHSLGLAFTQKVVCSNSVNSSVDFRNAMSFRFWGAPDTSDPALSLYSEDNYGGDEVLVLGGGASNKARAGIRWEIKSLAATGNKSWRLFEGSFLDGRSMCYKVPVAKDYFYNFDKVKDLKLINSIRSVFSGCDLKEVEKYKKHHLIIEGNEILNNE